LNPAKYIREAETEFRNSKVKITALVGLKEIEVGGDKIGPMKKNGRYEVALWAALELEKQGVASICGEDMLTTSQLHKLHWTEKIQPSSGLAALPEGFYPELRLLLSRMQSRSTESLEALREYERCLNQAKDIVNCRLQKIVSLASAQVEPKQALANMTEEERRLYEDVRSLVENWRRCILEVS